MRRCGTYSKAPDARCLQAPQQLVPVWHLRPPRLHPPALQLVESLRSRAARASDKQVSKQGSVDRTPHCSVEDTGQLQAGGVCEGALLLQTSVERPQVRSAGPDCGEDARAAAVCIGPRRDLAVGHRLLLQLVQQRWHRAAACVTCGALGDALAEALPSNQRTFLNFSRNQLLLVLDHTTARRAPCSWRPFRRQAQRQVL